MRCQIIKLICDTVDFCPRPLVWAGQWGAMVLVRESEKTLDLSHHGHCFEACQRAMEGIKVQVAFQKVFRLVKIPLKTL